MYIYIYIYLLLLVLLLSLLLLLLSLLLSFVVWILAARIGRRAQPVTVSSHKVQTAKVRQEGPESQSLCLCRLQMYVCMYVCTYACMYVLQNAPPRSFRVPRGRVHLQIEFRKRVCN